MFLRRRGDFSFNAGAAVSVRGKNVYRRRAVFRRISFGGFLPRAGAEKV